MTRALVLGIGAAQVDFIKLLKDDFEVHACSNAADGPGRHLVDSFAQIDIADRDGILAYARLNKISLVHSVGSDLAMPTACWVSEQLGLPTLVGSRAAEVCKNKVAMRECLQGLAGAVPFQSVSSADDAVRLPFPFMVKPADSQGQRGVARVGSANEYPVQLAEALRCSPRGQAILEQVVEGPEISAHAFVVAGQVRWLCLSDRVTWPGFSGGLIHKHIVPSTVDADVAARARILIEEVVDRLGIGDGPVYFQIKVQDGKPYLIEVAPRLDGCHMWRLLRESTGTDLLTATLDRLRDRNCAIGSDAVRPGVWTLEFFCAPPGSLMDRRTHRVSREAVFCEWYYPTGAVVTRVNGHMEKCGYQIVRTEE